jgi:hypothetical protein
LEFGDCAAHEGSEFVVDDLNNLLAWGKAGEDFFTDGPLLDSLDKIPDNLVVNVRF